MRAEAKAVKAKDYEGRRKIAVEIQGLVKKFHNGALTAVDGVACAVEDESLFVLLGHNGAGKTSFIRLISGIYKPTKGYFKTSVDVYPMVERSFIVEKS